MIKFAFVDRDGRVGAVISPGRADDYEPGSWYGDYFSVSVPVESCDVEVLQRWRYEFESGQWCVKPLVPDCPGEGYFWCEDSWCWLFNVEEAHDESARKIDATAEQTRLKYLTPGSGQAMEYEEVYRQAMEFISNPSGHYPMLQADVDAGLCETVEQAASTVIAMRQQWEQAGQAIRRIRLEAKRRIRESNDPAEIARIREEAVSLLSGL